MNFDIRTLSILTAVSSLVFAFATMTVAHLVPKERNLRDWAVGSGLAALSTLLVGLRGVIPDMVSAAVANTLLTLGFTFMYRGSRGMVRLPPPAVWVWLYAVFAFISLSWYTVVQPSVLARIVIVSGVAIPLLALTGYEFWRYDQRSGPTPLRLANRVTSLIYAAGVVLFIGRIFPAWESGEAVSYLNSSSALLVGPYLWAILFNVWLAIMVTLTVSARLQADLVEARDQAEANSVAKSQFLANMSHEIRTPMNAILGMLKLLQSTELTHRQLDYTSKSEGAARALLGLLNDILDFSKVEAGKMALDPQPFRVAQLQRDLSVLLCANLGGKSIEVQFDVDSAIPPVLVGDAMRLQQVLLNLGGNAIKFTAQGQVVIRMRLRSLAHGVADLAFAVEDTGIGIAPDNQNHIFSGFAQAEASTTRRYGGTGLGLTISQRLVGLMGGNLQLSSVLGQGSTFSFDLQLPVGPDAPPVPAMDEPASAQTSLRSGVGSASSLRRLQGMRLLVVEDNPINQQVAQELLASQGALVSLAANGQLGVDAVAAASPQFDAVLMDIQMPVLDGYAATRKIRQQLGLAGLPIIAMTANAMASDREACLAAGMDEHVGKPFELAHLVAMLQRYRGAAMSLPVLDFAPAVVRMAGMEDLYLRAAREFVSSVPSEIADMERLVVSDTRQAAALMHTLKGTSAMLGAVQLSEAAAALERACGQSGMVNDPRRDLLATVRAVLQSTLLELQGVIARLEAKQASSNG